MTHDPLPFGVDEKTVRFGVRVVECLQTRFQDKHGHTPAYVALRIERDASDPTILLFSGAGSDTEPAPAEGLVVVPIGREMTPETRSAIAQVLLKIGL